jgi:hypothetical protein
MPLKRQVKPGMIPFWMLNDASTVAEKIAYLRACRQGGIEAAALHCRSGNLIPYGSREWFDMIRAVVEEGQRLGMEMWLYDEDPYPSGAAGGMVMAERRDLIAEFLECREPSPELKPGDVWTIGRRRIVWAGLVPCRRPLPPQPLTERVGVLRRDWFMGRWDSRYYYEETPLFPCPRGDAVRQRYVLRLPHIPRGYKLVALSAELAGIDGSWGGLPDLLNPESFALFRRLVLDPYHRCVGAHFGATIPGIFTDEPKAFGATPITGDLWEDFERYYGYDLRPRLYQLFGEPLDEHYVKTRLDYRRWIATRFLDAFLRPYRRYCDEHDLCLVGHLSPEDDPISETPCLGSAMPVMRTLTCAGTDIIVPSTGNAAAPTLNLGSARVNSVKQQSGQPYGMSETLALCGWSVTSARARQILAWQKVLGIDRFFIHGFYTSNDGVQNYEALPDYGPNSAIFQGMTAINAWLKRLETVMEGSADRADVAIVNSMTSFWSWSAAMQRDRLLALRRSLWQTLLAALRAHVGFHLVDETDLADAKLESDGLRVGRRVYRCLIVPASDRIETGACEVLQRAAVSRIPVFWFGGGPRQIVDRRYALQARPKLEGRVLPALFPDEAWYGTQCRPLALISGAGSADCYARRFQARDGRDYLLAALVEERGARLTLSAEADGRPWAPVEADGETSASPAGTVWQATAGGCGLFVLDGAAPPARVMDAKPLSLARRTFRRLAANILRLTQATVTLRGQAPVAVEYPRPYWQLFKSYQTSEIYKAYIGDVPVESQVSEPDLRYRFTFHVREMLRSVPRLVLDPRCARGSFDVVLNGKRIAGKLRFPLDRIEPLRLPLRALNAGLNQLEFRFTARSAMEGLLSQVFLEGEFDVAVNSRRSTLRNPECRISAAGWQAAGLPHYMGGGVYRWTETLTRAEAAAEWRLELDGIVDSAALFLNGVSQSLRAWAPWQWPLAGLQAGRNGFELRVSGTAGNKHELDWPNQPQGWIGGGRLIRLNT